MMKKRLVFSKRRFNRLMKFTNIKGFVLFSVLALALAGCGSNQNTPSGEKKDVSITIALEDGKQFNENEFVAPQVSVDPSSITPAITYYSGETSLGETAPQTVGDYKIVVTTKETKEYNAGLESKSFLIRKVPTLSFYYGEDQKLEDNHRFDLSEGGYNIYAKSSIEGATIEYTYMDDVGNKLSNKPTEVGVYYLKADVERTETIGSTSATIGFELIDSTAGGPVDPIITFFYDGEQACLESNWLIEGFWASHFDADKFDINKLTYTVYPEGASYAESWTLKALDAPEEADGSPISKPTANPLDEGIYTITITVSANSVANAGFRWAGFVINPHSGGDEGPVNPVIKFYYDGAEACLDNNWLIEGFGPSHFDAADFDINKLTYTVYPEGADYAESWTIKALDAPEDAEGTPISKPAGNPLGQGIYTITITVTANSVANAGFKWAGFVIN